MLLGGRHPVLEAIINNKVHEIYIAKSSLKSLKKLINLANDANIKIHEVDSSKLDMLYSKVHQGVVAVIDEFRYAQLDCILKRNKQKADNFFAIILDHIQSPHNLGAIIRTACVFGITCVIIPKDRSVHVTSSVLKVASGGCEHIPIVMVNNIVSTIKVLQKNNIWVYAADLIGENIFTQKFEKNLAIIIGSEEKGVSNLAKQKSDFSISIPMQGKPLSLNASVAAGIIIAEVVKQHTI